MKYWKLLLSLFIIILVAVCVYLYFLTAPSVTSPAPTEATSTTVTDTIFGQPAQNIPLPNQSASPTAFVTSFYAWYLQGLMASQGFSVSDQFKSSMRGWLTQDFANNWSAVAENTGSDPVLLTQDYQNSWITNIQVTISNQAATTSTVFVSLGTSSELQKIIVHLVPLNETWRISAVTPAP